jgi:hypothetical protein
VLKIIGHSYLMGFMKLNASNMIHPFGSGKRERPSFISEYWSRDHIVENRYLWLLICLARKRLEPAANTIKLGAWSTVGKSLPKTQKCHQEYSKIRSSELKPELWNRNTMGKKCPMIIGIQ